MLGVNKIRGMQLVLLFV